MSLKMLILTLFVCLAWAAAAPTSTNASITSLPHFNFAASDDSTTCSNKNTAVTNAIGKFCANPRPNIQAEGTYRVMSDDDFTHEDIQWGVQVLWLCGDAPGHGDGEGGPAGEMSDDVCFSTWWSMCALGDEHGGGITTNQGEQECQEWTIPTLNVQFMGANELYWGPFPPDGPPGMLPPDGLSGV